MKTPDDVAQILRMRTCEAGSEADLGFQLVPGSPSWRSAWPSTSRACRARMVAWMEENWCSAY